MSDEELMLLHGLDRSGLDKLLRILVEKGLVQQAELQARARVVSGPPASFGSAGDAGILGQADTTTVEDLRREARAPDPTRCPQCGAPVTKRMLTCPECGHVLPGEERWESVEPKPGLWERIPPKVLGCIVALPAAVLVVFIFKDMLLPMTAVSIEKKSDRIRQEVKHLRKPLKQTKEVALEASMRVVESEVARLIQQEVLSTRNEDCTVFIKGFRWANLSRDEKMTYLNELSRTMESAQVPVNFQVQDYQGRTIAHVTEEGVRLDDD